MGLKFTLDLEGAQAFDAGLRSAEDSARRLGTTLEKLQNIRRSIPGLATPPPTMQQMMPQAQGGGPGRFGGLGVLAGAFSPWMGALSAARGSFWQEPIGKKIADMFGGGKIGQFAASYVLLAESVRLLKGAFDMLKNAIEAGAKLFFDAAKLRITPGALKQAQLVGAGVGLSSSEVQSMAQSMMFGRGKMGMGNVANLAGLGAQSGSVKYLSQLSSGDAAFWNTFASKSRDLHVIWTGFSYTLERTGSILLNEVLPAFQGLLIIMQSMANADVGKVNLLGMILKGLITQIPGVNIANLVGQAGFTDKLNPIPTSTWKSLPQSSFERMGFVIGNNTTIDYQRQIATNTSRMVGLLTIVAGAAAGGGAFFMPPDGGWATENMPGN